MRIVFLTLLISVIFLNKTEISKMCDKSSIPQNNSPLFSFGLITDVQYADCESAGTRYYRNSPGKLKSSIDTFKKNRVSFIVNLGDLIDRDFKSFKPVMDILYSSGLKTYHCTGNHDYNVENYYKDKLPVAGLSESGYYSFSLNGYRLVFLNGNEISTYASPDQNIIQESEDFIRKLKEEGSVNAIDWNGGIGKEQLTWLDNQLDEASAARQHVLIFCHFPLAPEDIHNLLNYREVLSHIENNSTVIAWINGHNHAGNYAMVNGIYYLTFKGMVETETVNSFSILEVYRDKILVRGFGNEKDQILYIK
jgi:manganese-dependent ADP-ribose/CDP-alcohol diphosphatase